MKNNYYMIMIHYALNLKMTIQNLKNMKIASYFQMRHQIKQFTDKYNSFIEEYEEEYERFKMNQKN